jgi:uncharacterized protein (DUF488 family)
MKIFTIGFTRSSAEHFFTRLKESTAQRLVDVWLNNVSQLAGACLLCSEATPHHCHRRLVAEYLRDQWRDVNIVHLQEGGSGCASQGVCVRRPSCIACGRASGAHPPAR